MRFESIGEGAWELVDAHVNSPAGIFGESKTIRTFGNQKIGGEFTISHRYEGCPFCGVKSFFTCGACGQTNCYVGVDLSDGKSVSVTCAKCGNTNTLVPMEELTLAEDYTISDQ